MVTFSVSPSLGHTISLSVDGREAFRMAQIVDMQALEDLLVMVVPEISREHIRRMVTHGGGRSYSTTNPGQPLGGGGGGGGNGGWQSSGTVTGPDGIGSSISLPEKRGGW